MDIMYPAAAYSTDSVAQRCVITENKAEKNETVLLLPLSLKNAIAIKIDGGGGEVHFELKFWGVKPSRFHSRVPNMFALMS